LVKVYPEHPYQNKLITKKIEHCGKSETYRQENEKMGRSNACSCGNGKKYKKYYLLIKNLRKSK
jgi:hypothetical protein